MAEKSTDVVEPVEQPAFGHQPEKAAAQAPAGDGAVKARGEAVERVGVVHGEFVVNENAGEGDRRQLAPARRIDPRHRRAAAVQAVPAVEARGRPVTQIARAREQRGARVGGVKVIGANQRRRVVALKEILKSAGFDEDRVWIRWISASEGQRFADTITEMTAAIKKKGPNPLKSDWAV